MSNYIDGSFFVPYFTLCQCNKKMSIDVVLLVCMECFQGSSRLNENFVPESECKGRAFF